jgi:hypothetical protein
MFAFYCYSEAYTKLSKNGVIEAPSDVEVDGDAPCNGWIE